MAQSKPLKPPEQSGARRQHWSRMPRFLIGQDHRGNWVVQDRAGLCGGLFVNRAEALRFAMHEHDGEAQAAVMVAGLLELAVGTPVGAASGTADESRPAAAARPESVRTPANRSRFGSFGLASHA